MVERDTRDARGARDARAAGGEQPSGERMLHLNLFMRLYGHHPAAWQRESATRESAFDPDTFVGFAQSCERGLFDAVFLADAHLATFGALHNSAAALFEPLTLLSYIAAKTERIGLIGTLSASFHDPFNAARSLASLDLISRGRAGVNLVTSQSDAEAPLHGMPALLPPAGRYARAQEFAEVMLELWQSYPHTALAMDKVGGDFIAPGEFRPVSHHGDSFDVDGVLNIPASPQGRPVLVQAGASPQGRDLAARYAEAIYGIGSTLADARDYYEDIKRRTRAHGRDESEIVVLPGVVTVIGETLAEAQDKKRHLDSLKSLDRQLEVLGGYIGMDCSALDRNDPMPELPPLDDFPGPKGRYVMMQTLSTADDGGRVAVGTMLERISAGGGHFTSVGTPSMIADELATWFHGRAADGFNVNASTLPEGIDEFVDLVVPELQERGIFRTAYEGSTLRGHFGQRRHSPAAPTEAAA
ncbi:NtaA/DmoA family FMN-dependent monooxygenase [Herbiconiux moechotypicola]|uniref:LLM class flavin-dependent oxidoreductase n=1 Tax=Herbiconiux moechotypicola TaxID=637393 RepID=A0ABN3E3F9_9MICO|nr:NtaA/DmoA family FMN-dependent monooxygenase [Herbiconiux moechotypicola]MCS5731595.1 NtaA/DmoA family FMN-dependent monooxygenase [Herbiconiux moechotypicola]